MACWKHQVIVGNFLCRLPKLNILIKKIYDVATPVKLSLPHIYRWRRDGTGAEIEEMCMPQPFYRKLCQVATLHSRVTELWRQGIFFELQSNKYIYIPCACVIVKTYLLHTYAHWAICAVVCVQALWYAQLIRQKACKSLLHKAQ